LYSRVVSAERAVQDYRSRAGISQSVVQGVKTTVAAQQLSNSATELSQAQATLAASEARLQQLERLTRNESERRSMIRLLDEPVLVASYQNLAELQRRLADLQQRFGERHPAVVSLNAELAEATRNMNEELNRAVQSVRNEVRVQWARVEQLSTNLARDEAHADDQNRKEVQLRALEREAEATRAVYETFLGRAKETSAQHGLEQPDVRIISFADIPRKPSFPNPILFIALGFGLSMVCGIGAVLVAEHLNTGFVDSTRLKEKLRLPLLAVSPALPGYGRSVSRLSRYVTEKPFSIAAEAARSVIGSLALAAPETGAISVVVTSSVSNEGKTTTCMWLARVAAQSAQRVIVVDGDTRRPSLHRHFNAPNEVGLGEVLADKTSLEAGIRHDTESGVDYITSGRMANYAYGPAYLHQMQELVEKLKQRYDLVLIDSPPLLAMSDGLLFGSIADQTVFVCRWRRTNRNVALRCVEQLHIAGARVTGAVMSMVNLNKHAQFSDEYGYQYLRDLRKYYAE
jgi:capsular exopolysaccharide synthesis family protein